MPRRVLPVDGTAVEAGLVVAQGVELGAVAQLALVLDAETGVLAHQRDRRGAHRADVRHHPEPGVERVLRLDAHQAIGSDPAQPEHGERHRAAPARQHRDLGADRLCACAGDLQQRGHFCRRPVVDRDVDPARNPAAARRQVEGHRSGLADEEQVRWIEADRQPAARHGEQGIEDQRQDDDAEIGEAEQPEPRRQGRQQQCQQGRCRHEGDAAAGRQDHGLSLTGRNLIAAPGWR